MPDLFNNEKYFPGPFSEITICLLIISYLQTLNNVRSAPPSPKPVIICTTFIYFFSKLYNLFKVFS